MKKKIEHVVRKRAPLTAHEVIHFEEQQSNIARNISANEAIHLQQVPISIKVTG